MTDTSYGPMRPDPSGQTGGFMGSYGNPGSYNPYSGTTQSFMPQTNNYPTHGDPSTPVPTSAGYLTDAKAFGLQQGLQTGMVNAQPQMLASQEMQNQALFGIAGANANQALESGYLNQNYNLANARNQLAMQGNQVDIGANARQPGFLTALHNIAGQQFDLSRLGEQTNADVARRGLESGLTGRGAFTSVGGQQGRFDIANQLLQQTQGTNLQQQGEGVNFNEKMAQTQDQKQKLDLQAKDYGITGDQLKASLDQGLGRLNLSTGVTTQSLLDKIHNGTLQDAAMAQQVMNQAMQYSDYYQRSGLYQPTGGTMPVTGGPVYNPLVGAGTEKVARGVVGGSMR